MIFDYVFHGKRAGWFFPGATLLLICFLVIPGIASAWDCPGCSRDSIISSREWSPGLLSQEFAAENLTMNTTIYGSPPGFQTRGSRGEYRQFIRIESESTVRGVTGKDTRLPLDRILRSEVQITNPSENFFFGFRYSRDATYRTPVMWPVSGELDSRGNQDGEHIWTKPTIYLGDIISHSIEFCPVDPFSPFGGSGTLVHAIGGFLRFRPDLSVGHTDTVSCDHRQGFTGAAVNMSFISVDGESSAHSRRIGDLDDADLYPGTGPANFTYIYTVDYCEHDLNLGFCPGGVKKARQIIRFSRNILPAGLENIPVQGHSFTATGSRSGIEPAFDTGRGTVWSMTQFL
jgi:hypothetical protein